MKKLLTLVAAAFMAVSVFAQNGTALELKGGWNAGFAGDADVYDFTISKLWGAAEFACNVNSADYPKYILEFEDPPVLKRRLMPLLLVGQALITPFIVRVWYLSMIYGSSL